MALHGTDVLSPTLFLATPRRRIMPSALVRAAVMPAAAPAFSPSPRSIQTISVHLRVTLPVGLRSRRGHRFCGDGPEARTPPIVLLSNICSILIKLAIRRLDAPPEQKLFHPEPRSVALTSRVKVTLCLSRCHERIMVLLVGWNTSRAEKVPGTERMIWNAGRRSGDHDRAGVNSVQTVTWPQGN